MKTIEIDKSLLMPGVCKFKKEYDILHNCYEFNYFQTKDRA